MTKRLMMALGVLIAAAMLWSCPLEAAIWGATLDLPHQRADPGSGVVYTGAIANQTGAPLMLNGSIGFGTAPETRAYTIAFSSEFLATNLIIPQGGYSGPIVEVAWADSAAAGVVGTGDLILSAADAQDSTVVGVRFVLETPGSKPEDGRHPAIQLTEKSAAGRGVPGSLELHSAAPNPFNPSTTIAFSLPASAQVRLWIYDVSGRLVRSLLDDVRPAGTTEVRWDGTDDSGRAAPSGTYFCRLVSPLGAETRKMGLIR